MDAPHERGNVQVRGIQKGLADDLFTYFSGFSREKLVYVALLLTKTLVLSFTSH